MAVQQSWYGIKENIPMNSSYVLFKVLNGKRKFKLCFDYVGFKYFIILIPVYKIS